MEIFFSTLNQMLLMFLLIIVGILLRKKQILPEISQITLAKLETYVLVPALNFYAWSQKCSVNTLIENAKLVLYGLVMIVLAIVLAYPISKLFVKNSSESAESAYQRNIYKYALAFGNYGYVGNYIILGVFGNDAFFRYSMFTFTIAFFCASWGIYTLNPEAKDAKQSVSGILKRFFTPPIIGLLVGVIVGITNIREMIPSFIMNAASNAGNCMGPISMLLAGFVVGGYDFKKLLCKKKVYIVTLLRLIVIPSVFMILLQLAGVDKEIMTLALIAFATPLGLNTIVYPATYGQDTSTGASMAMISNTMAVFTIPLMYLVFIVAL